MNNHNRQLKIEDISYYCFTHAGKFSCTVDCFLELIFAVFKDSKLNCIERSELFQKLSSMSANAVFSDIFRLNTVGSLLGLSRVPPHERGGMRDKPKNVCVGGQVYSSYKELHHIFPSYQCQSFSTGQIPAEQRRHFHTVSYLTKSSLSQQPFNARNSSRNS